jgi:hypothetical protein
MDSTSQLLLPGVEYFQVVFTIPAFLSSLALGNRKKMYDLLCHAAWGTLQKVIAAEHGFEAAALMVLHTWNQKLEPHAHVHAVVPGGGPALDGRNEWIKSSRRKAPYYPGPYLVDADELRAEFRKQYVDGLRRLHQRGGLKLDGDWSHLRDSAAFDEFLKPLEAIKWVTYIQPPPEGSTPEHVLKYLARYLTGGPISNSRLISGENGRVTFWARSGKQPGGDSEQRPCELSGVEFVRRWSLHILPKGYTKTRRYGGFSNRHCKRYMATCRELLPSHPESQSSDDEHQTDQPEDAADAQSQGDPECPYCGRVMNCIGRSTRPHWSQVMHSPLRPIWYDDDG